MATKISSRVKARMGANRRIHSVQDQEQRGLGAAAGQTPPASSQYRRSLRMSK